MTDEDHTPAVLVMDGQVVAGIQQAGRAANYYAAQSVFGEYRSRLAAHTIRRHLADLRLFADYLADIRISDAPGHAELAEQPDAWSGITWGLIKGFARWQLVKGYAVGSINVRLSTLRTYARLAAQSGVISPEDLAMIASVKGYSRKEQTHIDERRESTRVGKKKATPVRLVKQQASALKRQPDTPQGRRDAIIMCLLLDHGLRVSEVVRLQVEDVNMEEGSFTFYRPKVNRTQTHRMTVQTQEVIERYIDAGDAPESGPLLRATASEQKLGHAGISTRAVAGRVKLMGIRVGTSNLSPHDCRHYWATTAARSGTHISALQDAGGWTSPAMPSRYIEAANIANEGVKLE